ncbi:aspartyl-tRNA amidotransferase [Candidatus Falkowbacteria bacterium RIFOXYB2_FULL_47_14]|uniref:Aspartyl-tRNA amidotransferase n=1 Tax=Candidatus Falkowbacteria bacterium RIFOXYA2_FULL_47_19 TaxID=1797994 RepID=A0A1F5SHN6_9BACT|nr:MAG: aspartyl-tRNA amidotransferase [Candidatus Falkowbacteria bacterium RIFOXYA2_FULL_47_19]OGF36707.1 MAG: aspartyl-tRNA amidotransferase [Candidatus Falkowbacteria bacterium RIFOXYC2_FULL_46_15]OGF42466.1 MAG: aspartyl-tRNA amidotransferase [Candidatus Falkowbacteria bacterium RIFOXYB2_FULL_47_14]
MAILSDINNDLKEAMRSKEELKLSTLRMIMAALKNKKIELGNKNELTDEEAAGVLKTEVKKRRDSASVYEAGNRDDLAEKEKAEIAILEKYMPAMMDEAEIEKITKDVIASLGEIGPKDFGKVMGAVMAKVKGKADGGSVNRAVKKVLAG